MKSPAELLEVIASYRPELLPALAGVLRLAVGGQVAERWGVAVADIADVAGVAAARLDRFERRRGGWDLAGLAAPVACAIADLAAARSCRVAARRRQLLERLGRQLADVVDRARIRRGLVVFLSEPARPVELSRYLPDRRAGPVL